MDLRKVGNARFHPINHLILNRIRNMINKQKITDVQHYINAPLNFPPSLGVYCIVHCICFYGIVMITWNCFINERISFEKPYFSKFNCFTVNSSSICLRNASIFYHILSTPKLEVLDLISHKLFITRDSLRVGHVFF